MVFRLLNTAILATGLLACGHVSHDDDDDGGSGSNTGDDDGGGGGDDGGGGGGGTIPAKIELSTTTLDFGLVSIATPPMAQTVTVKNTGGASASPTFALSGGDAASFALGTNTCSDTLAGGASCTIEVELTVTHDGAYQGTLDVTNDTAVTSASLLANAQSALLQLSPPTDDFGDNNLGSNQTHQYTLTNTGDAALPAPVLSLAGAQYTTTASTCTNSLAAGASCTFSVVFAPTTFGAHTAIATAQAGTIIAQSAIAGRGVSAVTVNLIGSGSGSVDGMSCTSTKCTATLTSSALAMTATANAGSSFSRWAGDANACGGAGACNLQITTGSVTATATFDDLPTITVFSNTSGLGGSVSLSTGGSVASGQTKSFDFTTTTTVTLTANKGNQTCNQFQGWSGDCLFASTNTSCTLTVSGNANVSAGFGRKTGCVDP